MLCGTWLSGRNGGKATPVHFTWEGEVGPIEESLNFSVIDDSLIDVVQKQLVVGRGVEIHHTGMNDASEMLFQIFKIFPFVEKLFTFTTSDYLIYKNQKTSFGPKLPSSLICLEERHLHDNTLPFLEGHEQVSKERLNNSDAIEEFSKNVGSEDIKVKTLYQVNGDSHFLVLLLQPVFGTRNNQVNHEFVKTIHEVKKKIQLPSDSEQPVDFFLIGIVYVVYDGNSSGHYVAHSRRNDKWYLFNDKIYEEVDEQQVLSCSTQGNLRRLSSDTAPFLLFYARESDNSLPPVGLDNPGAACYFSALMQCLMPAFMHAHRSGWM